jgi:hypothetical protein
MQEISNDVVGKGKVNIKALKASMIPVIGFKNNIFWNFPRFAPE